MWKPGTAHPNAQTSENDKDKIITDKEDGGLSKKTSTMKVIEVNSLKIENHNRFLLIIVIQFMQRAGAKEEQKIIEKEVWIADC